MIRLFPWVEQLRRAGVEAVAGQQLESLPDMFGEIRIQGGERRHGVAAEERIADADQRHLLRHPDAVLTEAGERPLRKLVIQSDEGAEAFSPGDGAADGLKGVCGRMGPGRNVGAQLGGAAAGDRAPDRDLDILDRVA